MDQVALAAAVLVFKPLYMLLALALIVILWRSKSSSSIALLWGTLFFLAGETACGINIVFFDDRVILLEYFHMLGMVVGFSFVFYALFEVLDKKIFNFSDPQKECSMFGLCKQCVKYTTTYCALKRLLYFLLPAILVLAVVPLLVDLKSVSYNIQIFGRSLSYSHPVVVQIFELRGAPIFSMIFIFASFLALLFTRKQNFAVLKVLPSIALGSLAFSYLRMIFFGIYPDNLVWPEFWEELTELMFISGVIFTLWVFDRGQFFKDAAKSGQKTR